MNLEIKRIIGYSERMHGVAPGAIMSHNRSKNVALARNVAMYLARHHTPFSYPELATAFKRHHTSVIAGVRRINTLTITNLEMANNISKMIMAIEEQL